MQKTFLFASVIIVTSITLLSVHLQLSQASADTVSDATPATTSVTATLTQAAPQIVIATTSASTTPLVAPKATSTTATTSKPAGLHTTSPNTASSGAQTLGTAAQYPERLLIPSLDINVPIVAVGVNARGEMDVPPGNTNEVGWYKGGPMPGSMGSAVLDAHVFAAFKTLRDLPVGADIYVQTKGGSKLHFVVKDSRVYTLSELTSNMLFGSKGERDLNLITCAGTYVPSMGTYDHRLVDYATFVGEE